mgnify:FL=1
MGVDDLFIENGLRHVDENFLVFLEAIGAVQTMFEFVWKATLTEEVEANKAIQTAGERERERERASCRKCEDHDQWEIIEKHLICYGLCLRPYHVESTGSRPITEVKQRRARLVLGWVTAWEYRVL